MNARCLAAALAVLLAVANPALAQTQTGEITGRVTDSSAAVLPGVTVTLTSPVLLQPLSAVTSENGSYRFPNLPVGLYDLRFELSGFRTVIREGVRIETGFTAQVNSALDVSAVQETITVSGESPIVDTTRAGTGTTFNQEMLQRIPSARDPWVMLEQTAGITMDRANVGGTQSGQQSGYISRGGNTQNNMWAIDGVVITDLVATGSSSIYFDFDAFEEMQVSTGGNDASLQTGGVGINLVTKSGTDRFKGSARYYVTDEKFQSDNVDAALREQGAGAGNPIQQIFDYGIEGGGPLYRGRAWFWGSYGKQDIDVGILGFYKRDAGCPTNAAQAALLETDALRACLQADTTTLDNYNLKGSGSLFRGNQASWLSNFAEKFRNARDASDLRPAETVYVQKGPVWTHKFSDQHIFSDRWLADFQFARVGGNFSLDFPDPSLAGVQRSFEISEPAGLWGRSFQQSVFDRPLTTINLNTSYFLPARLGGDHAIKAGVLYQTGRGDTFNHVGGNTTARFTRGVATNADLHRDAATAYELKHWGFFLQDTYTRGRLTGLVGLRFDSQADKALAASVDAHPFVPELLPAVSFAGADPGVTWNDWSPRLGLTYDVFGTGRTVVRTSYSIYYGQMGPGSVAAILNPLTAVQLRLPWTDTNGDQFVQRSELDLNTPATLITGNWNRNAPDSPTTTNTVDPSLPNVGAAVDAAGRTFEYIAGIDHELARNFAVGASYIWRKYDQFRWDDTVGLSANDYSAVEGFVATGCPGGCPAITYYRPNFLLPTTQVRAARPDYYRDFNGVEFTARKRYADNWMLNASLALNDAKEHFDGPAGYGAIVPVLLTVQSDDPTQVAAFNGGQYAPESAGSGIGAVFTNARWLVKVSGMYSLPFDVNLSAFYNARQGYPFIEAIQVASRGNGAADILVPVNQVGDTRLDAFQQMDVRAEKNFTVRGVRLTGSVDVFNVFNANTVLTRERQLNSSRAGLARGILAPRVARFGVRMTW
jgi:hypothetical protein